MRIDDGHVARQVGETLPGGADAALQLVATPTLPDTLGRSGSMGGVLQLDAVEPVDRA
jgi:hypothetical protein